MPFVSKAQLRACYAKHNKGWNCDEWLAETKNVSCLPERKGMKPRAKCSRGKVTKSRLKTGPRGGKYYEIRQGSSVTNVYVKRT
uniref:Uncharacterized protein n=1 Tax=viral metagenome TaxID=1070528 RepID=A0A6C0M1I9_9ZZZZ